MSLAAIIARLCEALDAGDIEYAHELALQLDHRYGGGEWANTCPDCSRRFQWPGDVEAHRWQAHVWRAA